MNRPLSLGVAAAAGLIGIGREQNDQIIELLREQRQQH